jgi:hypothetical protein
VDTSSLSPFAVRLTDLWAGLVSKPASAEDAAAREAREAAEGRKQEGARRRTARAARANLTLDPSLAEEVEPDDPEVDALAAQVAVETAAHQHGFTPLRHTG